MRRRRGEAGGTGLAFLDTISCGFGAMILLLLISRTGREEPEAGEAGLGEARALIAQIFEEEREAEDLDTRLQRLAREVTDRVVENAGGAEATAARAEELRKLQAESERLRQDFQGLEQVRKTLERTSLQADTAEERDIEVGGIPVDSEYVIFLLDTSGSMKRIWKRVVAEMENVLDVHPTVKGFQIINDNGGHLVKAYEGKWIPDTPKRRRSVLGALRGWNAASNSSPVEGLEAALRTYGTRGDRVAIYIFGDDYTGPGYDVVIRTLDRWRGKNPKAEIRVHAIGLYSGAGLSGRFVTLMREVTHRNNGTLLILPLDVETQRAIASGCASGDFNPYGGRCRAVYSSVR